MFALHVQDEKLLNVVHVLLLKNTAANCRVLIFVQSQFEILLYFENSAFIRVYMYMHVEIPRGQKAVGNGKKSNHGNQGRLICSASIRLKTQLQCRDT